MMKRTKIFLGFLILVLSVVSCDEKMPAVYDSTDGVYFNNRLANNTLIDSMDLTFVYMEVDTASVFVKVQSIGNQSLVDRPVAIRVTSDDAVEGVDYVLPEHSVLPVRTSEFNYVITLKRTSALQKAPKTILLEVLENDYFKLPITQEITNVENNTSTSMVRYKIEFSDLFTSPPAGWKTDVLGAFSMEKFLLACKVLEISRSDFNDPSIMSYPKSFYIQSAMTEYINAEVMKAQMGQEFDTDILDKNGELLSFM